MFAAGIVPRIVTDFENMLKIFKFHQYQYES